jgi:endonuclease/exonuclease/phosphatase family metal-dependent hydrolase
MQPPWQIVEKQKCITSNRCFNIILVAVILSSIGEIITGVILISVLKIYNGWLCVILGISVFLVFGSLSIGIWMKPKRYSIVSWNVGTISDFSKMCYFRDALKNNIPFNHFQQPHHPKANKDYKNDLLKSALEDMDRPDIICLQEIWQFTSKDFQDILPFGYGAFAYQNQNGMDCAVCWNANKFTMIAKADIESIAQSEFPSLDHNSFCEFTNRAPDTIVLLHDKSNDVSICVASVHLKGFSLDYNNLPGKQYELQKAKIGDEQTIYNLDVMKLVKANCYIIAGDMNVTQQHYPTRLDIIRHRGYSTNDDISPTIYDSNLTESDGFAPQFVKLDHIFVKGVSCIETKSIPESAKWISDHFPVAATIKL